MTSNPTPFRILALAGSLRRDGFNLRLLQAAARNAPAALEIHFDAGLQGVPLFDEDLEAQGLPEGVRRLREAVAASDGLLIATPEYNQSLPGVLKNAIDWLSRPAPDEVLVGKPVAVLGATAGRWGTRLAQAALRQTLAACECRVMPSPALYLAGAAACFDEAGALRDAVARDGLDTLLQAFVEWVRRTR